MSIQEDLFSGKITRYNSDFDAQWRIYKAPKAASKKDAMKAWTQTASIRPPHDLMLLCIEEYLCDIAKSKIYKAHFASWLRREGWAGYLDDAKYRLEHPAPKVSARRAFKASDYPEPTTRPTRMQHRY